MWLTLNLSSLIDKIDSSQLDRCYGLFSSARTEYEFIPHTEGCSYMFMRLGIVQKTSYDACFWFKSSEITLQL